MSPSSQGYKAGRIVAYECTTCNVDPHQDCINKHGQPMLYRFHAARRRAAGYD